MRTARFRMYAALVAGFALPAGAQRSSPPPDIPGATDDTFLAELVAAKPNLELAIARPAQEKAAVERLSALKRRHARAPNIVLVLLDDVGWAIPACTAEASRSARLHPTSTGLPMRASR